MFYISCDGQNTSTITHKRNRYFGTQKQIENMVKDLGKYTMECGLIYLNSLLRNSILYGAEAMLNIKENDFRQLEQIEEEQMRLLFKTDRSCPIHLLYLEAGHTPARFQIKRMQINMFQYILKQKENSTLYSMLMEQTKKPVKNDFYSSVIIFLKEFGITKQIEEIKLMKRKEFKQIVKIQCTKAAFSYLIEKQSSGSKGKTIKYISLRMADYLLPEANISLQDQRDIFSIRC